MDVCLSESYHLRLSARVRVINLGQPRVGNNIFAEYFDTHVGVHYRMVNQRDLVPHLPPMAFGFFHVGTEIWYTFFCTL